MPLRLFAVLAFISALMLSTSAFAESGNGNGNGNGNEGDRAEESGSGNGNGNGNGNGKAGTSEPESEPEPETAPETEVDAIVPSTPGTGPKADPPAATPPAAKPPVGSPEREALDARKAGEAVALEDLLPAVRSEGSEVLDAQLLTISGELVYELKVLSPSGTLTTRYFFARTGQPVGRN